MQKVYRKPNLTMEKLFEELSLTIQNSQKTKTKKRKTEPLFAVKKYNGKTHVRFPFYKPISKIVIIK